MLCESSKNQFGRPKKRVDKNSKIFWKTPLKKILDPFLFLNAFATRGSFLSIRSAEDQHA